MTLQEHREKAFKHLVREHQKYGHFPTLDIYPNYAPKKDRGWHYLYRSPFVHMSVLDSLLNAGFKQDDEIIKNAAAVLLQFKEPGDLWRYWNVNEAEFPTFSDVDQTSISSFALNKLGYTFNNKKILYSRIAATGEIHTWINADWKLFKMNPYLYFWLSYHNRKVQPILHQWKWITLQDHEPCIVANVVAYLGSNSKTKKSIEYVIDGWINDKKINYQHYDNKIILAFHIARAFKEGITEFEQIKESILDYIQSESSTFTFPELLLAYLCHTYFQSERNDKLQLKNMLLDKINEGTPYFEHFPYTTEKKKEYYGGSNSLTCAWFLEVTHDWNEQHKHSV